MQKTKNKKARRQRKLNALVLRMKEETGIQTACCGTCCHQGSEGDGYEYNVDWPVCDKRPHMTNLKGFPFKVDMNCWDPNFWHSKFVDAVDGTHESVLAACDKFREAVEKAGNDIVSGGALND